MFCQVVVAALALVWHGFRKKLPVFAVEIAPQGAEVAQQAQQKTQAAQTTQEVHFAEQVPHGMLRIAHAATPWQGFNDRK